MNVKSVTDEILQCLFVHCLGQARDVLLTSCRFHPDFHNHSSQIQREMLACVRNWLQSLGHKQSAVLARLSKDAVRNHQNVRLGGEGSGAVNHSQGAFSGNAGFPGQGSLSSIPGISQAQGLFNQLSGGAGGRRDEFSTAIGTVPVPESAPPQVPVSPRPVGGTAAGYFGDGPSPFASQPHMPPSYTGYHPSQSQSPHPARTSGPPHGAVGHGPSHGTIGHGSHSPSQLGFPGVPGPPPTYLPSGPGFPGSGSQPPYIDPPSLPQQELPYTGPPFPGQSSYPGQQETGYLGMSNLGGGFSAYDPSPNPPSSFPAAAPSFPQSGPGFPDTPNPQSGSGYGSSGYGRYGQGPY